MILAAILLLSLAVTLGLWLAVLAMRGRSCIAVAGNHAALAVLGLILLGKEIFSGPTRMFYNNAALLFVLALFGGIALLAMRISERGQNRPPPMFIVALHGALGSVALLLLVMGYMRT